MLKRPGAVLYHDNSLRTASAPAHVPKGTPFSGHDFRHMRGSSQSRTLAL